MRKKTGKKSAEKELLKRYPGNPVITRDDVPYPCNAVYNAGAVKFRDKYLLMLRIEDCRRVSHFHVAESDDGYRFRLKDEPVRLPESREHKRWEDSIYDPRITFLEGVYYVTYAAHTVGNEVRIGMFKTTDFERYERMPFLSEPWNRNCAIFPEKINGLYARLDRPMYGEAGRTWISYSPDLVFWGMSKPVNIKTEIWFLHKWGAGPPPIKTKDGWLTIFHGVIQTYCGLIYQIGVMLLDLENPSKVVGQVPHYIMSPQEYYERVGDVPNVVFPNGAIVEKNGDMKIYYGGADTVVCVATANLDELVSACLRYK